MHAHFIPTTPPFRLWVFGDNMVRLTAAIIGKFTLMLCSPEDDGSQLE